MGGGQQGCQQHLGAAGAEQHARWFEQHPPCAAAWHAAACPRWLHPLLLFVFFLPARRLGDLNPASLEVVPGAVASPELAKAKPGDRCASRLRAACPRPTTHPLPRPLKACRVFLPSSATLPSAPPACSRWGGRAAIDPYPYPFVPPSAPPLLPFLTSSPPPLPPPRHAGSSWSAWATSVWTQTRAQAAASSSTAPAPSGSPSPSRRHPRVASEGAVWHVRHAFFGNRAAPCAGAAARQPLG